VENAIAIGVILALIALGILVIHRMNTYHAHRADRVTAWPPGNPPGRHHRGGSRHGRRHRHADHARD
jgi:hypothetical protein